ncbi:MAG: TlpA family protein disulfide reductase [Deltaproteobacteria bacterium]|nr:TlpA family protein disulfide reductase [Deltaproteobacteria bacterium]
MGNETLKEGKGSGPPSAAVAAIIAAVVIVAAIIVLSKRERYEPVGPGKPALDFTLPDLAGRPVSLKDYRGKVVFLNFWATWCKPCEEEMPSMQVLYDSLKGRPFEILAVSLDTQGPDVVGKFVQAFRLTFPVLHDRKGAVKEDYKTTGVPETFIIDQNGVIAEKVWGPRDWTQRDSIATIIRLLQNGPSAAQSYKQGKE